MNIKQWWKWNIHTPIRHFFGLKAKTDWTSAYMFMAKKMLPYMYDFRDNKKTGIPIYSNVEYSHQLSEEQSDALDDEGMKKWNHIVNEIIFALEYCVDENDDDCYVPNPLYNPKQKEFFKDAPIQEDGTSEVLFNEDYGETKPDMELYRAKNERVKAGLKLMGEYFMNLWD